MVSGKSYVKGGEISRKYRFKEVHPSASQLEPCFLKHFARHG
jgi:hypothetical protein